MSHVGILICFALQFFSNTAGSSQIIQAFGLVIFLAAAVWKLYTTPSYATGIISPATPACLMAMAVISILVAQVSDNSTSMFASFALLIGCIAALILARANAFSEVATAYLATMLIVHTLSIGVYPNEFSDALLQRSFDFGKMRFSPFTNHPNLMGHMAGLLVVCCVPALLRPANRVWRIATWSGVVVGSCTLIATASRGSLVATALGAAAIMLKWLSERSAPQAIRTVGGAVILTIAAVPFFYGDSKEYITELFEVNSTSRGFDSGLTGRADNWPIILAAATESTSSILFGNGYRSWNAIERNDVDTDSSYVNLIWEFGFFAPAIVIFLIGLKIRRLWAIRGPQSEQIMGVLIFSLIASIFARYLVAVGNPGSILILCALFNQTPQENDSLPVDLRTGNSAWPPLKR